jgi:hypothetical protein
MSLLYWVPLASGCFGSRAQALESLKDGPGENFAQLAGHFGVVMRTPALLIYALILMLLYGQLLLEREFQPGYSMH